MTINSVDAAHDFLPDARSGRVEQIAAALRHFAEALQVGHAAHTEYQALVARGVHPSEAARRVFETHFKA